MNHIKEAIIHKFKDDCASEGFSRRLVYDVLVDDIYDRYSGTRYGISKDKIKKYIQKLISKGYLMDEGSAFQGKCLYVRDKAKNKLRKKFVIWED